MTIRCVLGPEAEGRPYTVDDLLIRLNTLKGRGIINGTDHIILWDDSYGVSIGPLRNYALTAHEVILAAKSKDGTILRNNSHEKTS